jgi:hypothetical protein
MSGFWTVRQYGDIVDRFRDRERSADVWDEVLINFAILIEKGPIGAGTRIAKKLRGGDGIWELIAHYDNAQPRLLFYVRGSTFLVFVHAFIKKGNKDYGPAIKLAKQRRQSIEQGGGDTYLAPIDTRIH